jgi:small GTP-binding protein
MKDLIRIVLVGEEGVGKSSLIQSYIQRQFSDVVTNVLSDEIIPSDHANVTLNLMDSSSDAGDRDVLKNKLRVADSIIALYDVTNIKTLEKLVKKWLPYIEKIITATKTPKSVIVCGTKKDMEESSLTHDHDSSYDEYKQQIEYNRALQNDILRSILKDYPFVFVSCRVSAKNLDFDNVFDYAETSILYPSYPLYNITTAELTIQCKIAFLKIFRLFDIDYDGLWSDEELNALQRYCFDSTLKETEISLLKKRITKTMTKISSSNDAYDDDIDGGIRDGRITFYGFLETMKFFIENSQPETPWTILRKFGYDDNLRYQVNVIEYDERIV